jgi:mRNA-degrading endonuclease toxin of MazEF toxin-antitoxin module
MNRGNVVIVDFPFTTGTQSKVRPAVVVRSDRENRQLSKTIIAMITGNLQRANQAEIRCLPQLLASNLEFLDAWQNGRIDR